MKVLWPALLAAAVGSSPMLPVAVNAQAGQDQKPVVRSPGQTAREGTLIALRRRAKMRMDAESLAFSVAELADIEARYASAFRADLLDGLTFLRRPEAEQILKDLVRRYPRSNRAGCALLHLAQLSTGSHREQYLRMAMAFDGDAWFESGVQVAALARAMLAVHLAGLKRFDEAEHLASELVTRFPGSIDQTGATLDNTLEGIKLLRPPAGGRRHFVRDQSSSRDRSVPDHVQHVADCMAPWCGRGRRCDRCRLEPGHVPNVEATWRSVATRPSREACRYSCEWCGARWPRAALVTVTTGENRP